MASPKKEVIQIAFTSLYSFYEYHYLHKHKKEINRLFKCTASRESQADGTESTGSAIVS